MTEKINSTNALVAYLDILGYSQLIKDGEYANIAYAAIDSSIFRWTKYADQHQFNLGAIVRKHLGLQVISDTFIVTLDLEKMEDEGSKAFGDLILTIFFWLISYLIQDCMRKIKLPIRGAIVRGKYYSQEFTSLKSNAFIFGEALVDAHKLAEEIADVPRVLIDKSILDVMAPIRVSGIRPDREILCDTDGLHYLNVYSSIFTDGALVPILEEIAGVIKNNTEKNKNKLKVLRKYHWLANFHNKIVNEIIASYRNNPAFESHSTRLENIIIDIPTIYKTGLPDWV